VGRKKLPIDPEQVKELARIGCSAREVAIMLGCHEDTITGRFSAFFKLGKTGGKIQLRRRQHERAMDGSDSMLIHLGYHRLAQRPKKGESDDRLAELLRAADELNKKPGQEDEDVRQ
jgi:hypothetical protein